MGKTNGNWGTKFGVLTPATNLSVEDELWSMRVPEATIATARIIIDQVKWTTPDDLRKFVEGVRKRIPDAADHAVAVEPDALILGISISVLWGGLAGNESIKQAIQQQTGLDLYTAVDAAQAALGVFGASRIGVVTPYPELADAKVVDFFREIGVDVVAQKGLRATSARSIGEIPASELRSALRDVCVPGVEAIVTLGTDLKVAAVAAQAEGWLGVPTAAVNTALWWYALRTRGIAAQIQGWGSLMSEH
ncbi:MAG: arylmalonate decarboxylase [Actinomycetota bacterium]